MWGRFEDSPRGVWDAVLLEADEDLMPGPIAPVRWGRLVTLRPCEAQAMGYPLVGRTRDDALGAVQRTGMVNPGSLAERDRYVLDGPGGAQKRGSDSPWRGMSGAALFCGSDPELPPLLTGVVVGDPPGWSHTHLEAVPAYVLASDPAFRDLITRHTGRPMLLEPADLQHITDSTSAPRPPRSPADLLRPEHAVVAFQGRAELLEELIDWCQTSTVPGEESSEGWGEDPGAVRARLLTGPGGAGKTRLSTELAARLAVEGWTTVRLTTDASASLTGFSGVRRPLLVVVDYAETRVGQLHALLRAVDRPEVTRPVRILALARAAGDWWTRAAGHHDGTLLSTAPIRSVPPLHHSSKDRADAYQQALQHLSRGLRQIYSRIDWAARVPGLTAQAVGPALTGSTYDLPLSVQMYALNTLLDTAATDGTHPAVGAAASLEARLLGHERNYWDETATARGLTGERTGTETRALSVALACMVPATDRDHARTLLMHLPGLGGDDAAGIRGTLATWLEDLYPAASGSYWGSLQPDRIGEHHLGAQAHAEKGLFTRILATLQDRQAAYALSMLTRTAEHPHHLTAIAAVLTDAIAAAPATLGPAAIDTATQSRYPAPLTAALTQLTATTNDTSLLKALHDRLPDSTLELAEWAAALTTTIVEHLHRQGDDSTQADLATALNNQSNRLAGLGRREEALTAITRAVETYQALAEARPDAFLPALAMSLNNQSACLAGLGRREEALTAITRAVDIRETLAEARPDAFLPDLAMSLNNQSIRLAGLGQREEALTAITRAVETYQTLTSRHPGIFGEELAHSLQIQKALRR